MAEFLLLSLTALLYGGLGAYFWRSLWRGHGATALPPAWEKLAVFLLIVLHAVVLYQFVFRPDGLKLGVGHAISAIAWLTVVVYWLGNLRDRMQGLQGFVLPFAAVSLVAPLVLPASHTLRHSELTVFKVHLLIAILAYSLFTIAALHALLMALVERRLHAKPLATMLQQLPPLLTMEGLLFRVLWAGFILLTMTLISGMVFSRELFGQSLQFSHKTLFALISWLIYATLLGGHQLYGWRGRTAIRLTLSGFVALLLAYIGSKFVIEVILHR